MDTAAARPDPIPVFAEMGSVNPVFLLPASLAGEAEAIAGGFVQSLTLGEGQFCTNPGLVFAIEDASCQSFIAHAKGLLEQHRPAPMLTTGIHAAYQQQLSQQRTARQLLPDRRIRQLLTPR